MAAPESSVGAESSSLHRLERTVIANLPGYRVLRTWELKGGISTRMSALEVEHSNGARRKLVARQPGPGRLKTHPKAAQREFEVVRALHRAQLPVPVPLWLEPDIEAFFVLEFIEGEPDLNPRDLQTYVSEYARHLAAIHRVRLDDAAFNDLPTQDSTVPPVLRTAKRSPREGEVRARLDAVSHLVRANGSVLCHGDLWPGNILWREEAVAGIIDWEEALIGEALSDLAICRLDLLWVLGADAVEEFTRIYLAQTGLHSGALPYWDLMATLRPGGNLGGWAAAYPILGRPDVTLESMTRDHHWFVEQALVRS